MLTVMVDENSWPVKRQKINRSVNHGRDLLFSTGRAKKVTPFWYPSFLPLLDALYMQFLFTYISFSSNA